MRELTRCCAILVVVAAALWTPVGIQPPRAAAAGPGATATAVPAPAAGGRSTSASSRAVRSEETTKIAMSMRATMATKTS